MHGNGKEVIGRILRTCDEMLKDRGCAAVSWCEEEVEGGILFLRGRGGEEVDVFLLSEPKVGVKQARAILDKSGERNVVLVSLEGATPFTKKECEGRTVQFMLARDLCVNVTKHSLVPTHTMVDSPPPNMSVEQLPRILDTDPIVQYYRWPIGSVVKVCRVFAGNEEIPYFRVVAPAPSS